jgi:hypothetical protein
VFPENFLTVRLEQPAFLEGRTRGYAQSGYNVYPLLYPLPEDSDPRDERVIGYHEFANAIGVKRNFWGRLLSLLALNRWERRIQCRFALRRTGCLPVGTWDDGALAGAGHHLPPSD